MEKIKDFIDIIWPEHDRTSCSDDNISNGLHYEDDCETISQTDYPRCTRCALLEIGNGTIELTEENRKIITKVVFQNY